MVMVTATTISTDVAHPIQKSVHYVYLRSIFLAPIQKYVWPKYKCVLCSYYLFFLWEYFFRKKKEKETLKKLLEFDDRHFRHSCTLGHKFGISQKKSRKLKWREWWNKNQRIRENIMIRLSLANYYVCLR